MAADEDIVGSLEELKRALATASGEALKPVFVLGCAWRCGSTLVQRLITSSRQVMIWGENQDMIGNLFGSYSSLAYMAASSEHQNTDFLEKSHKSWIANINPPHPGTFEDSARLFLLRYYYPETLRLGYSRWGFKEVRCDAQHVRFLLDLFPAARVVLLLRHPREVLASNVATSWYKDAGGAAAVARLWVRNTASFATMDDSRVYLLRYEDLLRDSRRYLNLLTDHLGLPKNSLESSVLSHVERGVVDKPALGPAERKQLEKPELLSCMRSVEYDPDDPPVTPFA